MILKKNSSGTVESTEGQSDSGRGDRSRDGQAREGQNRDNKNRDRNNDNDDRRAPRAPRTESAKDLLMVELPERSRHANARLRANLSGTIMVRLDDKPARYVVDWTGDQMTVVEAAAGTVDLKTIDCEIRISEKNLMKVVNGDLNPQIGMLSDKISVDGRLSLSVYLFNLLTPSAHY